MNLAVIILANLQNKQTPKEEKASWRLSWLMRTSCTCCTHACCHLSIQTFIRSCKHTSAHTGAYMLTPAKVDWISESHGLYVYDTVLKGSFHNGPRWGWDDGYGLSLGVSAAGLGPPQVCSVTSFAICQHWVGTNPWPGLGLLTPGPPTTTHTPRFQGKGGGGQGGTQVLPSRAVHLNILQFNLFLLSSSYCYWYTCGHWIIRSGFSVSLAWLAGDTGAFTRGRKI